MDPLANSASNTLEVNAQTFDAMSPAFVFNPYEQLAHLRRLGPVHFIENDNSWLVLDYDDVVASLRNTDVFSSAPWITTDTVLLAAEPAEHARTQKALRPLFDKAGIARIETTISTECEALLNLVMDKPQFDLACDLAVPITEITMNKFLGLSDEVVTDMQIKLGHKIYSDYAKTVALYDYFRVYLESQKNRKENIFYQALISSEEGRALSLEQIAGAMKIVFMAGTSSTAMLINNSVKQILSDQSLRAKVLSDTRATSLFIEEVLRFDPPVHTDWRRTLSETTIAEQKIPKDQLVKFSLAAANRDIKKFENASVFLHDRSPNHHIAFGAGIHSCLGASLARIESNIVIRKVFEKWPELDFASPNDQLCYSATPFVRELDRFEVSVGKLRE